MTDRVLWTDDFLVYSSKKKGEQDYLGRVNGCKDETAAVRKWNRRKTKKTAATTAVRITTFEGTLTHLLLVGCPVTLQWAARGKNDNAALAREIAAELGVKLPKPKVRKVAKNDAAA